MSQKMVTNRLGEIQRVDPKKLEAAFSDAEVKMTKGRRYANSLVAGTNQRVLLHLEKINEIARGADRKDVAGLRERFYKYVELCADMDMKIGYQNSAMAMGMDYRTLFQWRNGNGNPTTEQKALAEEVARICAAYLEQLLLDSGSGLNPVVGIFWQKNYSGLKDAPNESVAQEDGLGERRSAAQIKEDMEGMGEMKK